LWVLFRIILGTVAQSPSRQPGPTGLKGAEGAPGGSSLLASRGDPSTRMQIHSPAWAGSGSAVAFQDRNEALRCSRPDLCVRHRVWRTQNIRARSYPRLSL
jgi:hypothetical protein